MPRSQRLHAESQIDKVCSKAILIFVILLIATIVKADPGVFPSKVLLSTYGYQCPRTLNRAVSPSLETMSGLASALEKLKADNKCYNISHTSDILSRYQMLYSDYLTYQNESQQKLALQRKIAQFSVLLLDPTLDASQLSYIKTEIVQTQSDLVDIKSRQGRFGSFSEREARGANALVASVDNFIQNQSNSSQCYANNSAYYTSILSNTLLTTAAFAAPGTSLALASSAVIANSVGQYVNDFQYNKALKRIEDAQIPTAIRCVSEVISDQYCDAYDAQQLLKIRQNEQNHTLSTLSVKFLGLDLLSNHLASLSNWLQEVYAGSEISSQADRTKREKPILQANMLNSIKLAIQAYINEFKAELSFVQNNQQRTVMIAKAIQNLVLYLKNPNANVSDPMAQYMTSSSQSSVENPIFKSRDEILLPYQLLIGDDMRESPTCPIPGNPVESKCQNLLEYVQNRGIILKIEDVQNALMRANVIVNSTLDQVNLMRSRSIAVDPYTILVNANRDFKGQSNALDGLDKIVQNASRTYDYLKSVGCQINSDCEGNKNPYYDKLTNILITKNLTQKVIELTKAGLSGDEPELPMECLLAGESTNRILSSKDAMYGDIDKGMVEKSGGKDNISQAGKDQNNDNRQDRNISAEDAMAFKVTTCISKLLKLEEQGTETYFRKVRDMVAYEMEARLRMGELGDDTADILSATQGDLVTSILNSYTTDGSRTDIEGIDNALDSAQGMLKNSMAIFFDFFQDEALKALKQNKLSIKEKNDLCFRSLPYLKFAKSSFVEQIYDSCKQAQFQYYKNGPKIDWSDYVSQSPNPKKIHIKSKIVKINNLSDPELFCSYRRYIIHNKLIDQQVNKRLK